MTLQKSLLLKLEHYCAYQERCHNEVEKKAKVLGLNKEDTNLALYHLIKNNFLNEERFAELYARSKMNQKKWGPIKIRQGLFKKHINTSLITKTINALPYDEFVKNGCALFEKNAHSSMVALKSYNQRAKLKKTLFAKGYDYQMIEEIFNIQRNKGL